MFGDNADEADDIDFEKLNEGRLPTGLKRLDEENIRGYPAGSTIVVMGDERAMTETLGFHLASTGQPTQYITPLRPPKFVKEDILKVTENDDLKDSVTVKDLFRETDDPQSVLKSQLARVEDNGYFIVDEISDLNWSDDANFRKTLRKIYKEIRHNINGIALFNLNKSRIEDLDDRERQLLNLADIVLYVESEVVGSDLEHNLHIYKMRGVDKIPEQVFKLKLGDSIRIDTTRDL